MAKQTTLGNPNEEIEVVMKKRILSIGYNNLKKRLEQKGWFCQGYYLEPSLGDLILVVIKKYMTIRDHISLLTKLRKNFNGWNIQGYEKGFYQGEKASIKVEDRQV